VYREAVEVNDQDPVAIMVALDYDLEDGVKEHVESIFKSAMNTINKPGRRQELAAAARFDDDAAMSLMPISGLNAELANCQTMHNDSVAVETCRYCNQEVLKSHYKLHLSTEHQDTRRIHLCECGQDNNS